MKKSLLFILSVLAPLLSYGEDPRGILAPLSSSTSGASHMLADKSEFLSSKIQAGEFSEGKRTMAGTLGSFRYVVSGSLHVSFQNSTNTYANYQYHSTYTNKPKYREAYKPLDCYRLIEHGGDAVFLHKHHGEEDEFEILYHLPDGWSVGFDSYVRFMKQYEALFTRRPSEEEEDALREIMRGSEPASSLQAFMILFHWETLNKEELSQSIKALSAEQLAVLANKAYNEKNLRLQETISSIYGELNANQQAFATLGAFIVFTYEPRNITYALNLRSQEQRYGESFAREYVNYESYENKLLAQDSYRFIAYAVDNFKLDDADDSTKTLWDAMLTFGNLNKLPEISTEKKHEAQEHVLKRLGKEKK